MVTTNVAARPSPSSLRAPSPPSPPSPRAPSVPRPRAASPVDAFDRTPARTPASPSRAAPPLPSLPSPSSPVARPSSSLSAPPPGLGRGAVGAPVEQLQRDLVALGHLTAADMSTGPGIFGPRTEAALRSFQTASGVPSTGYYGTLSQAALQRALDGLRGSASPASPSSPSSPSPTTTDGGVAPVSGAGTSGGVGDPTGYSTTVRDQDWADVNRWDPIIESAAQEFGVPADLLKSMMVIESRGNPDAWRGSDGVDDVPAVGLMQVKVDYHSYLVPDADGYTPEGNVRIAAALLRKGYEQYGSWDAAITRVYFPVDDVNGTSQQDYLDMVAGLRGEINAAA